MTTHLEIYEAMLSEYPPTNFNVLRRWQNILPYPGNEYILQWMSVCDGKRIMCDQDLFNECMQNLATLRKYNKS